MKNHIAVPLLTVAIIILSGCATSEPDYTWAKGKSSNKENDYLIASSGCDAEAYKAIPMDNSSQSNCMLMPPGFARGMCNGSAARQNQDMRELRGQIYDGCMLNKGWHKEPKK